MTLLTRLFLLVFLAVLPAIAIQAFSVLDRRDERQREIVAQAERLLRLVEGEQARVLDAARHTLDSVAEAPAVWGSDSGACQSYLSRLGQRLPGRQRLAVIQPDGTIRCSADPGVVGQSAGTLARDAMERDGFVIGAGTRWPGSDEPVLPLAVPVRGADGRPSGAVSMAVSLSWLADALTSRGLPPNASLTVAGPDGAVLVGLPPAGRRAGAPLPESERRLRDSGTRETVDQIDADGIERIVAYAPMSGDIAGLFLAVGIDREAAMRDVARATRNSLALILAGITAALVAAWVGGMMFIRRPVETLIRSAQSWRDGNSAVRARLTDTNSEIGQLGAAFDAMAETLEARNEALARSERHLRAVLDSLPGFVGVLSPDGVVQRINRAALDVAGGDAASLVGHPFADCACWSEPPGLRARLRAALRAAAFGQTSRFDLPTSVDGRAVVLDFTLTPMLDPDGGIANIVASGIDVTERKRTEDALRVAEGRFRTALRTSGVSVFNQSRDLRYTWVHDPVLGIQPDELVGRTDDEFFATLPETAERLTAIKRRVIETGEAAQEEVLIPWNGTDHWFDLIVDPQLDREGRIVGVVCATIDVTERRRGEDAIRAAQENAERANLAKTKFLAAASHDLRQPVQSLYLFAAALRDRLADHAALPLLDTMNQSLDALKQLLDGLLDMSRLESGRIVAAPGPVKLADVLGRLAAEYTPRALERGLKLSVIPCGAWVLTDPALLDRILRNLIENALRYTRDGRILIGARRRRGQIRLEVWDTGIGIPADRLDEIFEEFTQLDDTGRDRGLGLGLAIVKRLSRLLRHRVTVRSAVGRGSVFAIELPGIPAPAMPRTRIPANDGQARGVVLVIDDEAIILLGLKAMLEGWGYDVLTARSREQALDRLRSDGRRPQIVLADYQLKGGETGPEALVAIQGMLGKDVPGVILTGDTTPERLKEAQKGGFRILHKPVFPSDLRKVMAGAA